LKGGVMDRKELELRVMNYFAENINLHKYWEIARDCAREICNMKFDDIISGGFEIPSSGEIKEKVAPRVPYDFNTSDFKETGPIDFSDLDENLVNETLAKIEAIYKKFHDAQTMVVAKATRHVCENLANNVKKEVHRIKEKYLTKDSE
jgi:hypothetical protein